MVVASDKGTHPLRFGIFEVDLHARELRRNGAKVKLQEQPFQLLSLLLEQPGQVVTREELQKKLWPADTFVDFDHSLNAAIRRLRDALGDSAENPRFVETVARRGYRFLAPVNGTGAPVVSQPTSQPATEFKRWRLVAIASLLLVSIVVGWLTAHRLRQDSLSQSGQIKQRRLTANPEEDRVLGAAISPDGKYLAFSSKTGLYLRQIDSGETHSLILPPQFLAVPAAWYPDGSHLVTTRTEGPKTPSSLWQVSIMGGTPRKLIDDGRLAAVSHDGLQIAFVKGPKLSEEIWLMGANGENPRRLVAGRRCTFGQPAWSPDGRRIAYVMGCYSEEQWQITLSVVLFDLDMERQETISPTRLEAGIHAPEELGLGLVWTADNHLVYSVSEPPPDQADSNLWSMALDHDGRIVGSAERLTAAPDEISSTSASADGKRIVYTKDFLNPVIYVSELKSGARRLGRLRRLTLDNWRDFPFAWTPDSKTVLFVSDRDGTFHIFKQELDKMVPELLVGGSEEATLPRLAPDNSTVLYENWPKLGETGTSRRLMRVPLAGGPPQKVLQHEGMGNMQCARLPSTLCLYDVRTASRISFFSFNPANGKSEELPQIRIQDEVPAAYNWSLSPDGKILATAKGKIAQKEPSVDFYLLKDGSRRTEPVPGWAGIGGVDFAADSRSVWVSAYVNTGKWALLNIDLQGRTSIVMEDPDMTIGWAIPAPDGRHIALWEGRGNSNVWMLERR